jgi:hypothetical protein
MLKLQSSLIKKSLKIPKGSSETVNRRRMDNTMAKRRRTDNTMAKKDKKANNDQQNIKLKIEQYEPY